MSTEGNEVEGKTTETTGEPKRTLSVISSTSYFADESVKVKAAHHV